MWQGDGDGTDFIVEVIYCFCFVFRVPCFEFGVLCSVFGVQCFVFCVLCSVFCVPVLS